MMQMEQEIFRKVADQALSIDEAIASLELLNLKTEETVPEPVLVEKEKFGLSEAQKALWFINRLDPDNYAYNSPAAFWLARDVSIDALKRSFQHLLDRHPGLRAVFPAVGDKPIQKIIDKQSVWFRCEDVAGLTDAEIKTRLIEDAHTPFDLERGPLMRITVFQSEERRPILLMTFHHIIFDGSSFARLINELARVYTAFVRGDQPRLARLQHFYSDFVAWQEDMLAGAEGRVHWEYWRDALAGEIPVLSLPQDRSRPPVQTFAGAVWSMELDKEVIERMSRLARASRCTLFAALFAAYKVLLYKYTRLKDIVVGAPVAGRPETRFEDMLGYFVNMVAVRDDLSANPSYRDFLKQAQQSLVEAMDHGDFPLPTLVERLEIPRDQSRTPIFQVCFIFQNWVQDLEPGILGYSERDQLGSGADPGALRLEPNDWIHETGGFDLSLDIFDEKGKTMAFFKYNPDLYDERRVAAMADHYQTLLKSILQDPDQRIFGISILSDQERRKILERFNDTAVDYPLEKTVHGLIEEQVVQTPDTIAVADENRMITYAALNRRANQLARFLHDSGIGPEDRVGLCLSRSRDMIVAILGILKAGGAYTPLDPTLPRQRLIAMLEDARPPVILTHAEHIDDLPEREARLVALDRETAVISRYDSDNPDLATDSSRLVYVTFTSGSTGRPKGVMITHAALVNAYLGWETAYRLRDKASAHLQMANFTFDVFSGDLVRALCSGAKLVICPKERLLEPDKLYRLMRDQAIDSAEFVPAVLRTLIAYLEEIGEDLGFMNLLVAGSDSWSVKEYDSFLRFCGPHTRLINSYGVTEATIDCSYFESRTVLDGLAAATEKATATSTI